MKLNLRTQIVKGKMYFYTDVFLWYYIDKNGNKKAKRQRKSMGLSYAVKPKNSFERKEKKEAIRLANEIFLKRETELQSYKASLQKDKANLQKSYFADTTQKKRKQIPIYTGVLKYFPDAICEVAKCSYEGNQQHHPDKPLHWDREKSTDELDALMRHLIQVGETDIDGIKHSAKVAWRALANLQKEIENENT